ncbi:MAG: TatD family hydrolase [Bacteroidales bacterium]|nr:TatD family hydrolase [Candidatus Colicola faecequi]
MIDTHCHIDDEVFLPELDAVVARQREAGVEAILVPGVNKSSLQSVPEVCGKYPGYLYPALGLHPEDVGADWQDVLADTRMKIDEMGVFPASETGVIAIGEIGLDYHWSTEYKDAQHEAFREQLQWAMDLDLPVMVHARDAAEDTLRIVKECYTEAQRQGKRLRGVMHCYSGSREIADEYLKMGWLLGVGGVITFKNCRLAEMLCPTDGKKQPVPLSSLVLETDAPYMAPVPHRGKPNESRYMTYVAARLAEAYGTTEKAVIEATNRAAKALFGVK